MSANTPENLKYTEEHEWAKIEEASCTIGITDFAQNALGDIVYVELPEVGQQLAKGESFGVIESIKSVSDLYSPLNGEVVEVNEALTDAPESINENPYDAWIVKITCSNIKEQEYLLSAERYNEFCSESS